MTRRYDVRLGFPLSVTARMTCAVPGAFGVTEATALSPLETETRGIGAGRPPGGADGRPPAGGGERRFTDDPLQTFGTRAVVEGPTCRS